MSYSFFRTQKIAPVYGVTTNFSASQRWKNFAPVWNVETNFSSFSKMEKFCPNMESHGSTWNPTFLLLPLLPQTETTVRALNHFFFTIFQNPFEKFAQCVVKFNHKTLLGCFLTFLVFSMLTMCSWSLGWTTVS